MMVSFLGSAAQFSQTIIFARANCKVNYNLFCIRVAPKAVTNFLPEFSKFCSYFPFSFYHRDALEQTEQSFKSSTEEVGTQRHNELLVVATRISDWFRFHVWFLIRWHIWETSLLKDFFYKVCNIKIIGLLL